MSKSKDREALELINKIADELATRARLYHPLSADDLDLAKFELDLDVELSEPSISSITPELIYIAFSAKHLPALVSNLRALSPTTHPRARSALIQILTLLPSPEKTNHYLRKFILSPLATGLPSFIASAFVDEVGIEWMQRHSGPGHVCKLLVQMLYWCEPTMSDDKQASIDLPLRSALLRKIADMRADKDAFKLLDKSQRDEITILEKELQRIDAFSRLTTVQAPLLALRSVLEEQIPGVAWCETCMDEPEEDEGELQACSRCKTVKYCGTECQTKAWKKHKFRCFAPTF
ncbi:hypothetical protein OF83DRAFT_74039 [Amylostereum chailletii]|nr:hypothetical protein OF83DRAFT_74039 [Amylostereum chailletii]